MHSIITKKTIAVFLDISKAFRTVDHLELLKMMPSFGIMKESCKWFTSHLNVITQIAKINNMLGKQKTINCGVPQGSILGNWFYS